MAVIHVHPHKATPVAQKLLAAAAQLGYGPEVVGTQSDGFFGFSFLAPDDVRDLAFGVIEGTVEAPGDTGEVGAGGTSEAATESEGDVEPTPKKRGRPRKPVEEVSE